MNNPMTGTERFEHGVWKFCTIVSSDVFYRFIIYIIDFNKPIMKNGIGVMFVWKKMDLPVTGEVIKYGEYVPVTVKWLFYWTYKIHMY